MNHKKSIHKIIGYFLLLIFVSYLTHGFIPHHHHLNQLVSSYDIHFCQDATVCTCLDPGIHQETEYHSDCLICDQLQKEFHNLGFVKEPIFSLVIAFQEAEYILRPQKSEYAFTISTESDIQDEIFLLSHGLRAPPTC